jgi:glycine cleavage system H lipoate-binding protein
MTSKQSQSKPTQPVVFAHENQDCVWARAGVVKSMRCINAFDCLGCAFDKKVLDNFQAAEQEAGRPLRAPHEVRRRLLGPLRKCRHTLTGRLANKMCSRDYNCARCPYDQMLSDTDELKPYASPPLDSVAGFWLGRDHYYHYGHCWARVEYGGRVRVGLDDFALRLLGPQDEISLPRPGHRLEQSRPHAVLRRQGRAAEALSPVDGVVVAVNHGLAGRAQEANREPYGSGWLMVIQPTRLRTSLKNLLFGDESEAWLDDEAGRLSALVAGETGQALAATGGEAVGDIFGTVPGLDWDRLVEEFLT